MKKKVLIGVLLLIELCSIYLMYKSNNNKEVLDNKEIKEEKKEKFAIMIENNRGEYKESTDSTFPGTGYYLNTSMSECLDIEGNKIANAVSGSNGSITLTNKYTSYCTLYFDKILSLGQFCKDQTNMGTCISIKKSTIEKVENMTSNEVGGMYRYQGTDNVNNWICFGTSNEDECTGDIDKYMYRILGITPEGQLALIKETMVKEDSTMTFQWNDKAKLTEAECGTDGSKCTWANSKIYNRLNGLCNTNNENCDGTGSGRDGQSNIFIGNSYYGYLNNNSEWLNKISNHVWKYGDTTSNGNFNGDTIYTIENAFKDSIPSAKIGLQYIHDYYYAYPGGKPGSSSTAKNAWIHFKKDRYNTGITYEWLISRYGVHSAYVGAWFVYSYGNVDYGGLHNSNGVRPVFYLNSNIKINDASGSKTDPFIITN